MNPTRWGVRLVLAGFLLIAGACQPTAPPITPLDRAADLAAAGSYTAAEVAYLEQLQMAPNDPLPALGLADLYLAWERPELGMALLEEAAERGAAPADLLERQLAHLRAAGRWDEVLAVSESLLAQEGSDLTALSAIAEAHLHLFHCAEAQDAAHRHLDLLQEASTSPTATVEPPERGAATILIWAVLTGDEARLASAAPSLGTGSSPPGPLRDLTWGMRLIRAGEWGLAACTLTRAVNGPSGLGGLSGLGGPSPLGPSDQPPLSTTQAAQAHAWLGEALSRLGRPQEGEGHLRQAVDLDPESALAWLLLGQHYLAQNSLEYARVALINAQRLDPTNPAPCLAIAELKAAAGQYDEVDRWIVAALDRAPTDIDVTKAAARFYLSRWLRLDGGALALARTAVQLAPDDAEAHTLVGWALLAQDDFSGARQALNRAIALDPTAAEAHYWRAVTFERAPSRLGAGAADEAEAARIRAADLGYPVATATVNSEAKP